MSNLFSTKILSDAARNFQIDEIELKLDIVRKWLNDYHHGTLKKDNETSREQQYNRDFFQIILGYAEKPSTEFSFQPKASTRIGQIPDAIIGELFKGSDEIAAVIELKGASINLDHPQKREGSLSPVQQGFKYKTLYRSCPFVIVSNFYEFRLYHNNQIDFETWTLDSLTDPADDYINFRKWYFLCCRQNLSDNGSNSVTINFLENGYVHQQEISSKYYDHYREVRNDLLIDIIENNEIKTGEAILLAQKIMRLIQKSHPQPKTPTPAPPQTPAHTTPTAA